MHRQHIHTYINIHAHADTHLNLLDRVGSGASFLTGECLRVTLHIVDLWRYYACFTGSGVTRCTHFMELFLIRMYLCVLHAGLWSQICTLMRLLVAEPRRTAGLLFPYQYLCGTILVTPYSIVFDWRISRAGPTPFYWPSCSLNFCLLLHSLSFLSFYGMILWGWGLRTDRALSDSLAVPTIFNNNNHNNTSAVIPQRINQFYQR